MELLEKIFSKREPEKPLKIELQKLDGWIAERRKEEMNKTRDSAKQDVERILALKHDAIEIIEKINNSEFSEELKGRVYKPVLTSKPLYVRGIMEALHGIHASDDTKYFYMNLLKQLKKVQNVQINQGRHLAHVFEEDFRRLGTVLNSMADATEEVERKVETAELNVSRLDSLASTYSELNSLIREKEGLEEGRHAIDKNIEKIKLDLNKLEQKIAAVEESGKFREYLALKAGAEENAKRRDALHREVLNMVGPLSRIFRKYLKTAGDRKVLNEYIEKPAVKFFSDAGGSELTEVLKEIRKAIGTLGLENAEEEKAVKRIEETINAVPGLARAAKKVREEDEKIKKELGSREVATELESLRKSRKLMAEEIVALEKNTLSSSERTAELEKNIPEFRKKLEEKISEIAGRKITLLY